MDEDKTNAKPKTKKYGFDCVSKPIPPGTKTRARLPRPGDPEPSLLRVWWPFAAAIGAALAVGVLLGRFVLP
jgi:hypothetical protein